MAFRVKIQPQAFDDLDSIAGYLTKEASPNVADKWLTGIFQSINSLGEMPERCPIAPESEELDKEVRLLFFGRSQKSYKIYFSIDHETSLTGTVQIFHVRHWARKSVEIDELEELMNEASDAEE